MKFLIFIVATLLVWVECAPSGPFPSLDQIPEQLRDLVPEEVKKFYADLTDEDKSILKEIGSKHASYNTEDEALEALKTKSPKLHEKAVELRTFVKTKVDSLKPEAKAFVESLIEKVKALKPKGDEKPNLNKLREEANGVITSYQALSEEAKADLTHQFPKISSIVHNEKFQNFAKPLLKESPAN